jgi:co-chaperonin GroES (HSP10)
MSVKEGDRVLVPTFGGTKVTVAEEDFSIFRDHECVSPIKGTCTCYNVHGF